MLLGNYSVLNKSPGRFLGGSTTSVEPQVRSAFNKSGANRNRFLVDQRTAALSLYSVPEGCYAGKAWILPQKSGSISGQNSAFLNFGGNGAGALGRNIDGTAGLVFGLFGTGGLISSASGIAGLTMGATGQLFASKAVVGTSGISLTAAGSIRADGNLSGASGIAMSASWTPYAVGWISGTTAEAGLTVPGIVNAVWNAASADYASAGTMGQKLNSAASGGVDYGSLSAAVWSEVIEAGYSASDIVRIMSAALAGRRIGIGTATEEYVGLDGATVRISLSPDAQGNGIPAVNGAA